MVELPLLASGAAGGLRRLVVGFDQGDAQFAHESELLGVERAIFGALRADPLAEGSSSSVMKSAGRSSRVILASA
ncbi:hypothetical protein [Streptomyces flavidovirens]